MAEAKKVLERRQVLALRGLRIPLTALKALRECGILCDPSVSIHWHKVPDRYSIRARESGGAVAHIGAYCGFVGENGEPLEWVERLDQLGRNGFHALVLAQHLVRIHMVRLERGYDLLITRHVLKAQPGRKRPLLENTILFHGVRGRLPSEPGDGLSIPLVPIFDDGFGRTVRIPPAFEDGIRGALAGASCLGCHTSHVLQPKKTERHCRE